MCGITGIVDPTDGREINRDLLRDMNDRQSHRGPDGSGYQLKSRCQLRVQELSGYRPRLPRATGLAFTIVGANDG